MQKRTWPIVSHLHVMLDQEPRYKWNEVLGQNSICFINVQFNPEATIAEALRIIRERVPGSSPGKSK